ncbi:TetR/AcrR family transcriptional regulator [Sedimentibacter sp. zth1]|uniref:TetR/AcrR family transcriptional regulator n=1 Tax=Sedimentibacter sp. zth1 TaxID=2816908 RepID=UPI001A9146E7|nr:TetR/AcrR family transcriptional regulator [Sedimentibacter sp. zth1]QSX05538.1 TetR/AcrR family transcriptional regulator [Sedimentibacter sp. zth1]
MQPLTKKLLIKTAYEMIWEQGFEYVTIRKIATKLDCSSAALYRHFDNLDHLMTYACIAFLERYIEEYKIIKTQSSNSLDTALKMWEVLASSSFYNPRIFSHLFLGSYRTQVYDIIKNYYYIFDTEIFNVSETMQTMLQLGELFFRNNDYIKHGSSIYTNEEISVISDLTVYTYCGMLETLTKKEYTVSEVEEMIRKFSKCLKHIYR